MVAATLDDRRLMVADWVNRAIREHGITPNRLAANAGLSHTIVLRYLNGRALPGPDACRKLAKAVGVDPLSMLELAGHLDAGGSDELRESRASPVLDALTSEVVGLFSQLSPERQAGLLEILRAAASALRRA